MLFEMVWIAVGVGCEACGACSACDACDTGHVPVAREFMPWAGVVRPLLMAVVMSPFGAFGLVQSGQRLGVVHLHSGYERELDHDLRVL